ncbi:MAG: hypothetical protein L3J71_00230 [Victivallaceae bacterium]|nr:hypothetical protein [Victivallaceae bacterium]
MNITGYAGTKNSSLRLPAAWANNPQWGIMDFTSSSTSVARMSPVENHEVKLLAEIPTRA